jgi:hypothetical protein
VTDAPDESALVSSRPLALPAVALVVLGVRRRNSLLVAIGAFGFGRATRLPARRKPNR